MLSNWSIHARDQIQEYTFESCIENSYVFDMIGTWKPVSVEPGKHSDCKFCN